jgi:hypothetical protein
MGNQFGIIAAIIAISVFLSGCSGGTSSGQSATVDAQASAPVEASPSPGALPSPSIPNLQAEILDDRNKSSTSPIANFDFRNFTYELPRGWHNPDGNQITLTDGKVKPIAANTSEDMSDEEKAEMRLKRRIGMSYVTTKFLDITGDGQDEALVILKVETTGSAVPQLVYVFTWKDDHPELIWPFRTGDRADGGLKDLRSESGELVVELYGQDRFVLGQTETGKVTGDEEQLCCPTYFTRSRYKWNGKNFLMQGKRLTFSVADPSAPPQENLIEKIEKERRKHDR